MSFKDHFSQQADTYRRYRPDYPQALFAYFASKVPRHHHAWDCGTGNGQAAMALTRWFDRVTATDPSQQQLECAPSHAAIDYRCAPAEKSPLDDNTVSLVTVAQALHWFDWVPFYQEVSRVTVTGGLLAVWGYGLFQSTPAIDREIHDFYNLVVGPYWPPERRMVEQAYAQIPFPFQRLNPPKFSMTKTWSRNDLLGYVSSWSALVRYREAKNHDPLPALQNRLARVWPADNAPVEMVWELFCQIGLVS